MASRYDHNNKKEGKKEERKGKEEKKRRKRKDSQKRHSADLFVKEDGDTRPKKQRQRHGEHKDQHHWRDAGVTL